MRSLVDAGHEPRALVRSRAKLDQVRAIHDLPDVDHVLGDATDPTSIRALLDGCDALVHTAAVAHIGHKYRSLIEATNVPSTALALGTAVELGLDPIVHLSSTAALHPPATGAYHEGAPISTEPLGEYAMSKALSEQVARQLQADGHPVVIVWPSSITGPDDAGLSVMAEGTARLLRSSVLPLPATGGNLMHDVRDLANALSRMIEPGRGPRRYGVFGHFLDWDQIGPFLEDVTGRRRRIVRLPNAVFHLLGRMGDLSSRVGVDAPLDLAAARFMTTMVPGDDEHTRRDLGVEWRPLDETWRDLITWLAAQGHLG